MGNFTIRVWPTVYKVAALDAILFKKASVADFPLQLRFARSTMNRR